MAWYTRVANVFRTRALSADLDEELQFHIAERIDDLMAAGMSREDARATAARAFGNYTLQRARTRDMDITRWLDAIVGDLRYGARQLRLAPGFTAVAVLSLALGIGANSAMFQLVNALGLRSLPVPQAARLATIGSGPDFYAAGWSAGRHRLFTYAQLEQMTAHQEAFSSLMAFGTTNFNLSRGGEARYAQGLWVTPNFLGVLGVTPVIGSWMPATADARDCSGAGALLNYDFWQREYGGDVGVLARDITLNGRPFPIIGVTPASFYGVEPGQRFDVALPICAEALLSDSGTGRLDNATAWWLTPIGRLEDGWTVERASAHMRDLSPTVFEATLPTSYRPDEAERYLRNTLRVDDAAAGVSSIRRQFESPLLLLLAITGLVLLIACANLANLLLARASARQREMALRQAIGASRGRLVGQLMAESALLAGLGTLLGAWLGYVLSRGLVRFIDGGTREIHLPMTPDWRVFGFTAALALGTCLTFGLVPALRGTSTAPAEAMRAGRGAMALAERHGLRRALVSLQFALSLVLLVGALLFVQSLRNLATLDTGMNSDGVLMAHVSAELPHLDAEHRATILRRLEERVRELPDVASAAAVALGPFSGSSWNQDVRSDSSDVVLTWFNRVSPGYFQTMGTPLLAGRDFTLRDDTSAAAVAIVNQKLAQDLFGEADPLGRTFRRQEGDGEEDTVFQIVGVVKNTKYGGLREDVRPIAFLPLAQDEALSEATIAIRARGPFNAVMAGVREEMALLDAGLLVDFAVFDEMIDRSILRERLMANLSGGFGLLAGVLCTLGLYGVMAYMVARRRTELGVRMALGAETHDIVRVIVGEAGRLVAVGLVLGLASAFVVSRYAESLLFGLQPNDALTMVAACGVLAATGLVAALLPAHRAARLDPAVVLRDE